jgi:hypothetical protein
VDVESSGIPGFIAAIGVAAISLAAIRISRNSNDNDQ